VGNSWWNGTSSQGRLPPVMTMDSTPSRFDGAPAQAEGERSDASFIDGPPDRTAWPEAGPFFPPTGPLAWREAGIISAFMTGGTELPVYSGGADITSWRFVSLDNAKYVELTISW
jgi:hypothetical protein